MCSPIDNYSDGPVNPELLKRYREWKKARESEAQKLDETLKQLRSSSVVGKIYCEKFKKHTETESAKTHKKDSEEQISRTLENTEKPLPDYTKEELLAEVSSLRNKLTACSNQLNTTNAVLEAVRNERNRLANKYEPSEGGVVDRLPHTTKVVLVLVGVWLFLRGCDIYHLRQVRDELGTTSVAEWCRDHLCENPRDITVVDFLDHFGYWPFFDPN